MAASAPIIPTELTEKKLIAYYESLSSLQNIKRSDFRFRWEKVDRAYQREQDLTEENRKAKAANDSGDSTKFQNMTVPVVMPQVESAVTYQTSVFLTGDPLFGVVAPPQYIDEALQLETVIENNAIYGKWVRELMLFFQDGFKYNLCALEVDWQTEVTYSVETNLKADLKTGQPKEVVWAGNRVKRLDIYNTFADTRVLPTEVAEKGEFAGYVQLLTRMEFKSFLSKLDGKIVRNIEPALASSTAVIQSGTATPALNYYVPSVNPVVNPTNLQLGGTNWLKWASLDTKDEAHLHYQDVYQLTTLYCRIMPGEFDIRVPRKNTPQIYKLYIVNHKHIIYAELQTNAHNLLPILFGQPREDGLGYQTKSLAQDAQDFQELATAYMNSIIASRRRAISDRVLYDPSRITQSAINSSNPSAKIPVRPGAYGKTISDAVYQFPYNEDQAVNSMQQIQAIIGLANNLAGQNQASQGQFVKGNKTLHEFESIMQNANGRDQRAAILLESQVFTPMKRILKLNTLQYQGAEELYNSSQERAVEIDPVKLRKAVLNFRISDGLVPSEKIISGDAWNTALNTLAGNPEIGAGYNITEAFSYLMKTQGADLRAFEKSPAQLAYEQALGQWQILAQIALEKGLDIESIAPRPLPEEYGYQPEQQQAGNNPAASTSQQQGAPNGTNTE